MSKRRGPPCRKFTLLDAMILVGGAAVGFAGLRGQFRQLDLWEDGATFLAEIGGFGLMLASTLLLVIRLRRPRPSIRRIACQPGAVACFAAVAYGSCFDLQYVVLMAANIYSRQSRTFEDWVWWAFETPGTEFALIVPISWVLMVLSRRWRPEASWIDRGGRLVGWSWIIWGLVAPFFS